MNGKISRFSWKSNMKFSIKPKILKYLIWCKFLLHRKLPLWVGTSALFELWLAFFLISYLCSFHGISSESIRTHLRWFYFKQLSLTKFHYFVNFIASTNLFEYYVKYIQINRRFTHYCLPCTSFPHIDSLITFAAVNIHHAVWIVFIDHLRRFIVCITVNKDRWSDDCLRQTDWLTFPRLPIITEGITIIIRKHGS